MQTFTFADNGKKSNLNIVTSFYPIYIATLNVTENIPGVNVINMTKPQAGCLHDYQLTPQDLKTLSVSSIFVINGGGMENFLGKVINQYKNLKIIDASKGIELIRNECDGNHEGHEHGHEEFNPHVWVSVSGAIAQVKNICNALIAVDSANKAMYQKNGDSYIAKLELLRKEMFDGLASVTSRNIITFHEAFPYFAREFSLSIVAVIQREPGSEPSAGELAETIKIVKQHKVKALFAEPQYPAKAAQTIARETGVKLFTLDPAVTGEMKSDAYVNTMRQNLKVLQLALK
jgi:zinc transport system substrate-binding protein